MPTVSDDVTYVFFRTKRSRCGHFERTQRQIVRAPRESVEVWNRVDDAAWEFVDAEGDRDCDDDLVTRRLRGALDTKVADLTQAFCRLKT